MQGGNIHNPDRYRNPVKEGWVALPEHYCYSSAVDYSDKKGMIPIAFL